MVAGLLWPQFWQRWHLVWLGPLLLAWCTNLTGWWWFLGPHLRHLAHWLAQGALVIALSLIVARLAPSHVIIDVAMSKAPTETSSHFLHSSLNQSASLQQISGTVSRVYHWGHGMGLVLRREHGLFSRLYVTSSQALSLRPGDQVRASGLLRPDPAYGPTARRLDATLVELLATREQGAQAWAWRAVAQLHIPPDIAAALLLGQGRPALAQHQAFRRSGLLHVLAVSGLHVGLVLAGLVGLLRSCAYHGSRHG